MRRPSNRGEPIDGNRFNNWLREFSSYRANVSDGRVERWLEQFAEEHRDTAARLLDAVEYISQQHIAAAFRDLLGSIPGWNPDARQRNGKWRFVAFSGPGESGDSMLHIFRRANQLSGRQYTELFINRSDLLRETLGPNDTVVFVDDFAGTGDQACEAWASTLAELLPNGPQTYLMLVRACASAVEKIEKHTELNVTPQNILTEADNVFSPSCRYFSRAEKDAILSYCKKASRKTPRGYGDCGLVIVFQHACPNNSLPILHAKSSRWYPVFPAYD